MRFSLQSLMLSFVVVGTAIAAFGPWGIVVAVGLLGFAFDFRRGRFFFRTVKTNWWTLAGLFVLGCMIMVALMPDFNAAPSVSARPSCLNHLMQIWLGLDNYQKKNGSYPPAHVDDAGGKPMHSWRTFLLPHLEYDNIYSAYNMKEPWNGPNNRKLLVPIREFRCPFYPDSPTTTTYLAVVGPKTAWPGKNSLKPSDLPDGGSHTILLVEMENLGIQWSEPRDLTVEEAILAIQTGPHLRGGDYFHYERPGVTNVLFGDGQVKSLRANTPREMLEALLTINDKKLPSDIDGIMDSVGPAPAPKLRWERIATLLVLAVSYTVLLFRPMRRDERP